MEEKKVVKGNKKSVIILIVVAFIALGAGFFGGMEYQKTKKVTFNRTGGGMATGLNRYGAANRTGNANNMRPVSGQITSIDNGTITVKTNDGSSKIIVLSGSTKIEVTSAGSITDFKKGDTVSVIGTTDTSGTVTAQSIFIGEGLMQQAGNTPNNTGVGQPNQGK